MSYAEINKATDRLERVLLTIFALSIDEAASLAEAIGDLAKEMADQEIDRLFNRGDFRG